MENVLTVGDVVVLCGTEQRYEVIKTTKMQATLKKKDYYSEQTVKVRRNGERFTPYHEYRFRAYNSASCFTKEKP